MTEGLFDPYSLNAYRLWGRTAEQGPMQRTHRDPWPEAALWFSLPGLREPEPSPQLYEEAYARLKHADREIWERLTWFSLEDGSDQQAFDMLQRGYPLEAHRLWESNAARGQASSIANLAILSHIQALAQPDSRELWHRAFRAWARAADLGESYRLKVKDRLWKEVRSRWGDSDTAFVDDEVERLRLACAQVRKPLLELAEASEAERRHRINQAEHVVASHIEPWAHLLVGEDGGRQSLVRREIALIRRTLARVWGRDGDQGRPRCGHLEAAVAWAEGDLKVELEAELQGAREDRDSPAPERVSTEVIQRAGEEDLNYRPLPPQFSLVGTGVTLVNDPATDHDTVQQATYGVSLLYFTVWPWARYKIRRNLDGQMLSWRVPLTSPELVKAFLAVALCLALVVGVGGQALRDYLQPAGQKAAQREALKHRLDDLVDEAATTAQRLDQVDRHLASLEKQYRSQPSPELTQEIQKLRERRYRVGLEHQRLLQQIQQLEQQRSSLR